MSFFPLKIKEKNTSIDGTGSTHPSAPAMSGALPPLGSYMCRPSPREAEGLGQRGLDDGDDDGASGGGSDSAT